MRIVFLGTSHGVPEPNRRCSSTMIEVDGAYYFIDMGTQSIEGLISRGIRPEQVKACFVTHLHGDHTNGLISYVDLCNWYFKEASTEFYLPGDTERCKDIIANWLDCLGHPMREFKFDHVDDVFVYEDDKIKVSAFRTQHIAESFSYLLEAEGKRVFFSGDLRNPVNMENPIEDIPIEEFDKGLDLAILELAHFWAPDKYFPLLKERTNIKTVCINHYSDLRLPTAFELKKMLPDQNIVFAYDGLEFTL